MTQSQYGLLAQGEALRRAVRWLGEHGEHSPAALAEVARRFDLSPAEEAFMLASFGEMGEMGGNRAGTAKDDSSAQA